MIKVNLVPIEELENPFWYIPDLTTLIVLLLIAYFAIDYYASTIQEKISAHLSEKNRLQVSYQALLPDVNRAAEITARVQELNSKIEGLKAITASKLTRYIPVIVLEHFQNLKPKGLWLSKILTTTASSTIKVSGGALDNILIAEFLSAMMATENQEADGTDLRTQVYFKKTKLSFTKLAEIDPVFNDVTNVPEFSLDVEFAERQPGVARKAITFEWPRPRILVLRDLGDSYRY